MASLIPDPVLHCLQCQHANPQQARFCNQCGAPLETGLAADKATAPDNVPSTYTPKHLADSILTSRSALEGERKTVTVLFADIKGSMDLSEQVDPEEWHAILDRFFAIMAAGVHRYDGTINQYTGDGVMALFGAPVAHEDHAMRACRAALDVTTQLRQFANELRLKHELNIATRIGMNTGEVVVGKIGDDLRMDYTAQGHTVGLAARMEQIAEPGRVYVTAHTQKWVSGYFEFTSLGELPVKGASEPVEVFELQGEGPLQTRLDKSQAHGFSAFIGRDVELSVLQTALQQVQAGKGQVVTVVGDAGIGKSRLCFEFAQYCAAQGVTVHRASCVPYSNAVPMLPVVTLLKSFFGIRERDNAQHARRKVAGTLALAEQLQATDRLDAVMSFLGYANHTQGSEQNASKDAKPAMDPERARQQVLALFRNVCPLSHDDYNVILLEDVHWLDAASEQFVQALALGCTGSHVLLLLNHRPEYQPHWLADKPYQRIDVLPLQAEALQGLVQDLLGQHPSVQAVGQRIMQQAAGNPYFVEEAVRALVETAQIHGQLGAYQARGAVTDLTVPDTVQAILAARVDRLNDLAKHVLQVAAVIGKHVALPVLTDNLASVQVVLHEAELAAVIAQLEQARFLELKPDNAGNTSDRYRFCHPLVQEVVYRGQLKEQRRHIHRVLADYYAAAIDQFLVPDERSVLVAHHYERAGHVLDAAEWGLRAAAWSARNSIDDAKERTLAILSLLATQPESAAIQTLGAKARAAVIRIAGLVYIEPAVVNQAYHEARALAEATHDRTMVAELLLSYGSALLFFGDADEAVDITREAVQIARDIPARELEARMRIPMLITYYSSGRLREGLEVVQAGAPEWATGPVTEENYGSRGFRAIVLQHMGQLLEAQQELLTCIGLAADNGQTASWMHANLVQIGICLGDHSRLLEHAQHAMHYASEYGSPFFNALAHCAMAHAHIALGNYALALQILEDNVQYISPGQTGSQYRAQHLTLQAEAECGLGDYERSIALAEEALQNACSNNARIWQLDAHYCLARTLLAYGLDSRDPTHWQRGLQVLDTLAALVETTGAITYQPFILACQGEIQHAMGDVQDGLQSLKQAQQAFQQLGADAQAQRLALLYDR